MLPWIFLILSIFLGAVLFVWSRWKKPKKEETPFLLLQQQLDGLRAEIREQSQNQLTLLQKSHQGMDQRLDNAGKVFVAMESRMVKVEEATRQVLEVGKDISTLQQILRAPKSRGNFSEELLGDLLTQMMPRENFELQYTFRNGDRVDAVIKTAQGLVSVDAKFPLENFERLIAASTEEEKKNWRKKFVADVKKHIDDIADKYILPAEGTFEFALMYIPSENVYFELITRDLGGAENASIIYYAMKKKVIPVSPNTFFAYLQTILLGLRGLQVEKRVQEIVVEIARLRKELGSFHEDFGKLGKHLGHATKSFEESDKRLIRLEDKLAALDVLPAAGVQAPVIEKSAEETPLLEQ